MYCVLRSVCLLTIACLVSLSCYPVGKRGRLPTGWWARGAVCPPGGGQIAHRVVGKRGGLPTRWWARCPFFIDFQAELHAHRVVGRLPTGWWADCPPGGGQIAPRVVGRLPPGGGQIAPKMAQGVQNHCK
jgi:hypothetical protein